MKSEKDIKRIFADKDAFRREVSLARVQVEGLSRDELASALAYELEPYSKIPAIEADVAWRDVESPDGAMLVFDVALVRRRSSAGGAAGPEKRLKALVFLGVAVVLAVAADGFLLKRRSGGLEKSLSERSPLQAELDRIAAKSSALQREAAAVRGAREEAVKAQGVCAAVRAAYPDFLDALSVIGGRAVVKKISRGDGDFSLAFTLASSDEKTGSEVMSDLARETARRGWELRPGDIAPAAGALVEFNAVARFIR